MLPLEGVRVLAVEQYGAGPFGTQFLADLGAEVIKIENPADGGDMARDVGPHFFGPHDSLFFHSLNRGKKSVTLDIGRPEGRAVLHDLVTTAHAVACNLRGDVPAKLGLDYAALGRINRAIVCAHLTAYGRSGSRAAWPGYDYLMQAEAGFLALTGEPGSPPTRFGLSMVDFMAGLALAAALAAALVGARTSGTGRDVDVSLFDAALASTNYLATWYLNRGHAQQRLPRSAHPSLTPCQLYQTADGWIFIMCNKEKFWPALCRAVGRPEWAGDPRFADFSARLAHRGELNELLASELCKRSTAQWMEAFSGNVPAAPVLDLARALDNPFVAECGAIQTLEHPQAGRFRALAPPVRWAGERIPARPAPALGEHTFAVLRALGYEERRIAALRETGIV